MILPDWHQMEAVAPTEKLPYSETDFGKNKQPSVILVNSKVKVIFFMFAYTY